ASSPRAAWRNAACSSAESCRQAPSRAARSLDGLRSSVSIRRMVATEQPTCEASTWRVRSSALRRHLTQAPNENSSLMDCSMPACDSQRHTSAVQDCGLSGSTGHSAHPPPCGAFNCHTFCDTDCSTKCDPRETDLECNRATLNDGDTQEDKVRCVPP